MEDKLIGLLFRFGYEVRKINNAYHVFDRRTARRVAEQQTEKDLFDYVKGMNTEYLDELLKQNISAFEQAYH